jgi:hypothetical protein
LLTRGCTAARRTCDHPSKIVPAILREADDVWKRRRQNRADVLAAMAKMEDTPLAKDERCTPEEAVRIIAECGIKIEGAPVVRAFSEPPSNPTREDYIRWGVPVENLDTPPPTEPVSSSIAA